MSIWLFLLFLFLLSQAVAPLAKQVRCRVMTSDKQQCSNDKVRFFKPCYYKSHGHAGFFRRRKCGRCRQPMEFRRDDDGTPFIGCSNRPRCQRRLIL